MPGAKGIGIVNHIILFMVPPISAIPIITTIQVSYHTIVEVAHIRIIEIGHRLSRTHPSIYCLKLMINTSLAWLPHSG